MFFKILLLFLSLELVISYTISNKNECGIRDQEESLIQLHVNGAEVGNSQTWPWLVSLLVSLHYTQFHCTGSIISEHYVITAGHCVVNLFDLEEWKNGSPKASTAIKIIVGTNNYTKQEASNTYHSQEIILHPEYNAKTAEADIALIKVESPFKFSSSLRPICLPNKFDENSAENESHIAGWGDYLEYVELECLLRTHPDLNIHEIVSHLEPIKENPILHEGTVNLISESKCREEFERDDIPSTEININYTPKIDICAHGTWTNVQHGDSGGPMMYNIDGRWHQIGVISRGLGCGKKDVPRMPDLFTRITWACDWIANSTNKEAQCL